MDRTREQAEPQISPGRGMKGDVDQLRTNAGASAEELREFVSGLKGRSPQEVLGIVSATGLFRGIAQATIGCIVVLAAFTLIPWSLADDKPQLTAEEKAAVEKAAKMIAESQAEAAAAEETASAAGEGEVNPAAAIRAMGEDEVKPGDAKADDLDNSLNNLLELKD